MQFGGPLMSFQISLASELFVAAINLAWPHTSHCCFLLRGSLLFRCFLFLFGLTYQPP